MQIKRQFDERISELIQQKVDLQLVFCRMRTRLIVLYQEAEIYATYVTKDRQSLVKLEKCKAEQKEISGQQEALLGQLKQKSDEAHAICNGLIELQQQFDQSVAKDAPYRARLYKLYNKKLKRPKKKRADQAPANDGPAASLAQNEWADDSESSSSLSDLSNLSDDDDDEVDETKPPEGVSQELFDAVLGLREKKRALDVQLQAIQEQADALQGQAGQLAKKEKAILTNKQAAQAELTGFRSQKQQELNGI